MAIANRTPRHARPRRTLREVMKGVALLAASTAVAAAVTVPIGLAQGAVRPADADSGQQHHDGRADRAHHDQAGELDSADMLS